MDVSEVLGNSDTILPLLATAITTSSTHATLNRAHQSPAGNHELAADDKQGVSHEAATSAGQLLGQHATSSANQSSGQQAEATEQSSGQQATAPGQAISHLATGHNAQTSAAKQQLPEQEAGQDQSALGLRPAALDQQPAGWQQPALGTDPSGQQPSAPASQPQSARRQQAAPAKHDQSAPDEAEDLPVWLQPTAPINTLPPHQVVGSATGLSKACTPAQIREQQRRQEQTHAKGRNMPAGSGLQTRPTSQVSNVQLKQGYGQVDTPLDWQQAGGLGSLVAPVEVTSQSAGQDAQEPWPNTHDMGHGGQACGQQVQLEGQAEGQQIQLEGQAEGQQAQAQQAQHAGPQPNTMHTQAHAQNSASSGGQTQGRDQEGSSHSGVVGGECAVSSRQNAQHHLQLAAPLPWQQPENLNSAPP